MKDWPRLADFSALEPMTLWRCNSCGYVDVVRSRECAGCGEGRNNPRLPTGEGSMTIGDDEGEAA